MTDDPAERGPFPPEPPSDPHDAAAIIANDWSAFSHLESLEDHWAAPAAPAYVWFLTFGHEPQIRAAAAAAQAALGPLDVDPVPLDDLHLTLLRVGRADAVAPSVLRRVADAGVAACAALRPMRITVGPLAGSRRAVRFSVTPWHDLLRLRRALHEATAGALDGAEPPDAARFRPHVSIAYPNRAQPAAPVVSRVGGSRPERPTGAVVRSAHLVHLRRDGRRYRWDVCADAPLGGSRA